MDFSNTSDFVSGFWNMYVIVLVLVSILWCAWFLWTQGSVKFNPGEVTGHKWDETLEEYSNPLPNWWRWLVNRVWMRMISWRASNRTR
jgi:cytochrome c oxidase cbb3-type subunit 3